MREICNDVGAQPDIYGFSVKLPPNITLKQLSCCAKDLDTIFSKCPILRKKDGTITLSGVDIGSAWLTFIIAGSSSVAILGALAAMIDKIIQIRSHLLTLKEQEEELIRRRISNDIIKEMASLHKKIAEQISQNAVESLASSYDINCPEELQRLKYSMELLSDWMEKGIEILASVGAPQEIKALFPSVEQQKPVTQSLKELQAPDGCESQNKECGYPF